MSAHRFGQVTFAAYLLFIWSGRSFAYDHPTRCDPPFASQPQGADPEDDPKVSGRQTVEILRESLRASLHTTARRPLQSVVRVTGRSAERLGIRGRELLPDPLTAAPRHFSNPPSKLGGPPTPARLTLLPSSESSIQGLLGLIATAERRIDLMMYGWQNDPTGREVARALEVRARTGIRVRLLVDRTSDLIHNPEAVTGEWTFLDHLGSVPNVTLIKTPGPFLRFDHRKVAVVDDRVVWTGGMILTESARRRWHNLAFLAEGPIVAQYVCLFGQRWREAGGCDEPPVMLSPSPAPPNATVRMIRTDAGDERSLVHAVYDAVDRAKANIYLENPYFTDEILITKLVAARRRGVDVRVILTLRGNNHRLNEFERLTANRLMRGGIRVFLYPKMTHVKAMSVDGSWSYIGTGNFDQLSLRNNREVSLAVSSVSVTQELDRSLFLPDMALSEELATLLKRPPSRLRLELFSLWY